MYFVTGMVEGAAAAMQVLRLMLVLRVGQLQFQLALLAVVLPKLLTLMQFCRVLLTALLAKVFAIYAFMLMGG